MLKNLDRNWRKSLTNQLAWLSLDQNLKTRMLLQILLHPIGAKKNDASILPKAGCCYSVLTNFDFEWNKDKSATLFCPRFYQDCLYVIGNRHQIEIKVWCQFNESSIRVFALCSQQRHRSSTCALRGFFWLLSHVIYLKLTRELRRITRVSFFSQASIFEW